MTRALTVVLCVAVVCAEPARASDPEAAILMNQGLEQLDAWDVEAGSAVLGELLSRSEEVV